MRLANELDIKGEVKNSGGNVTIIAQGNQKALDTFVQRLNAMFSITDYTAKEIEDAKLSDFRIVHSTNDNDIPFITPDLATCKECEDELRDENNRRYHHPFISCVNCGPRYTIIDSLPYDRERITMAKFALCDDCVDEYTTPSNRRCHAQTIACNHCGPKTSISIDDAVRILENEILAIKDIGGYHLACRCDTPLALRLREIKGREKKPFAVMFKSLDEIEEYCYVGDEERSLLTSSARPIVLLEKKRDMPVGICDDSDYIGAFLPCNPIQIMILNRVSPLIMTSANLSGEPIIINDDEIKKFGVPVLSHDREILTPIDDSVVQVNSGRVQFIRRARGYVPLAIDIGIKGKDTLCLGGDLKSSFCITHNGYAYPSQYFGDLEDEGYLRAYKDNINRFCNLHSFTPQQIACDKHPMYYSTAIYDADKRYQHHLAHAYSVVAENHNELSDRDVLHFVFDGTGYGDDGAIWGGEVFLNTKRVEHLDYVKMPASDEIAKDADLCRACYDGSNELINKAIEHNINVVNSSSMGRLFDAVCSALDIKHYNGYEGECAIALESCAKKADKPFYLCPTLNPRDVISQIENADAPREEIALGFHFMLADLMLKITKKYNADRVTLSGGCFVNRILLGRAIELLESNGVKVYTNKLVSCGDNGLCLGQAYLSAMEE